MKERRVTMLILVPQLLDLFIKGNRARGAAAGQGGALGQADAGSGAGAVPRPARAFPASAWESSAGSCRSCFVGGAPLDPDLGAKWNLLGVQVVQGYGATETSPIITCHPRAQPPL